jgi:hypothetical protein
VSIDAQVHVGQGTTSDREGLVFGGVDMFPARDGAPARIIVALWDRGSSEHDFELAVGESFEFSGQTWRLDEIDNSSHRWYATLTRVA